MYSLYFKRLIDLSGSFFALVIFFIPILVVSVLIMFFHRTFKVFFIQKRTGKNAKLFNIIKLKTMTDERDVNGVLLPDEKRTTKIGKFIRSTSLDEIPQLFNVLKGDMSLVGPRPLLEKYIPLYSAKQFRRHEVKPGITGWAQINGRNSISWEQKFELDVWYVDNLSFLLDLKIFWITFMKVVKRKDISAQGQTTVKGFEGFKK
jgi:undecaprenyl phosphate N,N'-diacetylbacillosamine 1-phosphate transferase